MGEMSEITLKEIAQTLERKKTNGEPPTIFLGSRTGWFYGKEKLYDNMGLFSNKSATFSKLSDIEKFQECYKVLGGKRFSTGDIHDLFNELLVAQPKPR